MANNATSYGVTVLPVTPDASGYAWRVTDIRHVPPGENGGRHHIYFDLYDEDGSEQRGKPNARIAWTWNGRQNWEPAPPAPLEKAAPEHMANIAMGSGQVVSAWVEGDGVPSDVVAGLHTDHPDEGADVTNGHHSFVVRFRKALATPAQPPVVPPAPVQPQPPVPDEERAAIAAGLRRVADTLDAAAIDLRHLATAVEAQGEAKG